MKTIEQLEQEMKQCQGAGLKQSLSFTPTNKSCLDKITPNLCIGEQEFCCWSWKLEGGYAVYTYIDIPGNLLGLDNNLYTVQHRFKIL